VKIQHHVEGENSEDGLHQELHTQYLQGYYQQHAVDDDVGVLQVEPCGIIDDGGETRHTTSHYLIGHQEDGKRDGIDEEAKGYEKIVLHLIQNHFVLCCHLFA